MSFRNSQQHDFQNALSGIRAYRKELLDRYISLVEGEDSVPVKQIAVDYIMCSSLERECRLLENLLEADYSKR
jgi:hypothetical protein